MVSNWTPSDLTTNSAPFSLGTGSIVSSSLTLAVSTTLIGIGTVISGTGITAGTTVFSGSGTAWNVTPGQTVSSTTITATNPPIKRPYIWLDCSSSNTTFQDDKIVSGLRDLTSNGYDMLSLQQYDTIQFVLPRQNTSNNINGLETVTFTMPSPSNASGLTQTRDVKFSSGRYAHIVLVARQGPKPGTLFGLNSKYSKDVAQSSINRFNPWTFKRASTLNSNTAVGTFSTTFTFPTTLFTSSSVSNGVLCNVQEPSSNTVFMLSISNINVSVYDGILFNGISFNCESYQADTGSTPSNLNGWTGDFGEMLVWEQTAGANCNAHQTVEGYLAHKWGVPLSSNHPYYSAAPVFNSSNVSPFGTHATNVPYPILWLDASNPDSLQTNYVTKLTDKSGNGYHLTTRPETKRNVVWPTEGARLNGLSTSRFTQFAAITQPTSIENIADLFFVGVQNAIPSNATNSWSQNLLGHDNYDDFGCSLGNYNLGGWSTNAREQGYSSNFFGTITRRWYIVTCTSAATEVVNATGPVVISWSSTITPGGNNNLYVGDNTLGFFMDIRLFSNNTVGASVIPGGRRTTFGVTRLNAGQFTHIASGAEDFDFSTVGSNQQLIMILEVNDTNTQPSGTCSPGGKIVITSQNPKLYVNSGFPTQTSNPSIYYQSNGLLYHDNNFPPVGSPFILALKLPQTATQKITARFQGISYDSYNSNSGWTGDFAEMLVFKKKNLSENQSNLVLMYLANKWGLSLYDSSPPVVFPNVKPFSDFTPKSFKPIVWYDSSDSQVTATLKIFNSITNNEVAPCYSSNTPQSITPTFSVPTAVIAGKIGPFSALSGSPSVERPINGLPAIYIDSESSLKVSNDNYFFGSTPSNNYVNTPNAYNLTHIFFVGRQGQYSGQFTQWNSILTYSATGGDNILYEGVMFVSKAIADNINQVPNIAADTNYWKRIKKYQTVFGNLGYNDVNPDTSIGGSPNLNPLLGGSVIPYLMSPITANTTVTNVAAQASNSQNVGTSKVFYGDSVLSSTSNLVKASASVYSINQAGTARYQTTSEATKFIAADKATAGSVTFPQQSSTFLLSINGIQSSGNQDTIFRGLFYDDISSKDGWEGDFAELITFRDDLTPQEVLLVEGYLATKWGLQAALPITHPFFYSGTIEGTTCLTGYSPLTFGNTGAVINGSNNLLTVSGLPIFMTIPKYTYDNTSFLLAINSNANLPTGLSVSISGNQLTWGNTSSSTYTMTANTTQAATVFGIGAPPLFFTIPPNANIYKNSTYSVSQALTTVESFMVSELCGALSIATYSLDDSNLYYENLVSLISFPSGHFTGPTFAVCLQDFLRFKSGIPIEVTFDNDFGKFHWGLDPVFQTSASQLRVQLKTTNERLAFYLGLEVFLDSNNLLHLPSSFKTGVQCVGDPTFGADIEIFNVVSSNNTLRVGRPNQITEDSGYIQISNDTYTAQTFLTEVNLELADLLFEGVNYPISVTLIYQPYATWSTLTAPSYTSYATLTGPAYYPVYSYNADTIDELGIGCEENSTTLFGLENNASNTLRYTLQGYKTPSLSTSSLNSNLGPTTYQYITALSSEQITLNENSSNYTAAFFPGKYSASAFINMLQECIRAAFLPSGTAVQFDGGNWSTTVNSSNIADLNADFASQTAYLSVSNDNNYLQWNNTGTTALVVVPLNSNVGVKMGLGSGDAFTVYPNYLYTSNLFGVAQFVNGSSYDTSITSLSTTSSNAVIVNSNVDKEYKIVTETYHVNTGTYTSTQYFLYTGIFTLSQFISSNAGPWILDNLNYIWWRNTEEDTEEQKIIVEDPFCANLVGLLISSDSSNSNDGKGWLTLKTNFLVANNAGSSSGSPSNCQITVSTSNTTTITLSNSLSGSYLVDINSAIVSSAVGAGVLEVEIDVTTSRFRFKNLSMYDLTISADATAQTLFGMSASSWVVTTSYARSHFPVQQTLLSNVLQSNFTSNACTVEVNGSNVSFGTFSGFPTVYRLVEYLNAGFSNSADPFTNYVSVALFSAAEGYADIYANRIKWINAGPKNIDVVLNAAAQSFLGTSTTTFTIPRRPGNISPNSIGSSNISNLIMNVYGVALPQPNLRVVVTNQNISDLDYLKWVNNSVYTITLTPLSNSITSAKLGIAQQGSNGSLTLTAAGSTCPYIFNILPLISAEQTFSFYGGAVGNDVEVKLVDGTYNGSSLALMLETETLKATTNQILNVQYGNRGKFLTFVNTTSSVLTISGNLQASKTLGFVGTGATTAVSFSIPANTSLSCSNPLQEVLALTVCAWDGELACPTNFSEVTLDSNQLALPYAKKCAKPFSSLLPLVVTNAGLSNQNYSCPIGTERIATAQNADPDHPVCSYVCDAPYFDSGITCGYLPVYSPRDNKAINILNDNAVSYMTVISATNTSSSGSTYSAVKFLILAVIVSFLLGLTIRLLPVITENPPTESAAGTVLEDLLKKGDWPNIPKRK